MKPNLGRSDCYSVHVQVIVRVLTHCFKYMFTLVIAAQLAQMGYGTMEWLWHKGRSLHQHCRFPILVLVDVYETSLLCCNNVLLWIFMKCLCFAAKDDSLDLVCDLVTSHKVASDRMLMPRLLIVMPVVPSEHKRLVNNLREWQQNRSFPCGDPANSDRFGVATFMLLFSRWVRLRTV